MVDFENQSVRTQTHSAYRTAMKVLATFILLVAVVAAEPPSYRQYRQRQYYFAQQQQEETTTAAAPYAPSGWKPAGPTFDLPQKQVQNAQLPQQQYGAPEEPQRQYGAPSVPQQQYGVPSAPQQQYGASSAPQQQYGTPVEPQGQYGAPSTAQQQYGAPIAPQQQYETPSASQQQYGAPNAPQQQYGAPSAPQQQYGAPSAPQQQYGAPHQRYRVSQQRQYLAPSVAQRQYVVPQQQYGAPQQQYGTPAATTTEVPNTTEVEEITTVSGTESESEPVNSVNELDDEEADEQRDQQQSGEYYVALPDGRLQRVRYVSRQDLEAMKYFAKIRAENVEPLRGPIYAYAPLQKLQVLPGNLQLAFPQVAPITASVEVNEAKPEKISDATAAGKLEIEPVAAQVQYQYDNPSPVIPLGGTPVSSSYTTYTANYQSQPATEPRYLLSFQ